MLRFGLADVAHIGGAIAKVLRAGDSIGLSGGLGAGKTTLARAILRSLGLRGEAPSPSFAIVQPYAADEVRVPVLHVDLYRLGGPRDTLELGLDEALEDHALLIEWPDRLDAADWPDMLQIVIEMDGEDGRRLTATVPPAWEGRWPFSR